MGKIDNLEHDIEMTQPNIITAGKKYPESILEAMELISDNSYNSHLSDDFFKSVEDPANYLSDRLNITPLQSVLFSLILDQSGDHGTNLQDLAKVTGCSTTRMLRLSKCMDVLAEKHYIKIKKGNSCDRYRVPREVIMSLRDDLPYVYVTPSIYDVNDFFEEYGNILKERKSSELPYEMFCKIVEDNLNKILDSKFVKILRNDLTDAEDRILFIHMAYIYISMMDDFIELSQIAEIYDDGMADCIRREFRSKSSSLLDKLIENSNIDGMIQPATYRLTDYAKNEVLSEISLSCSKHTNEQLTKWNSLIEKSLVYNEHEEDQISELTCLLMPEKFSQIQDNLEHSGMRRGFCCIFYGTPGTGKTETVYQIARQTGRDLLQVNVNEIKSCWVGESEKNIKGVFDRYRSLCKDNRIAPILLFNEADAILGTRMVSAVRGVDKMENSIQNIILQEMENFDGIMIATTNLTENLDTAFERRFLYKIRFEKPTVDARRKIWMQMINGLALEDANILASRFNFSGGEIENIARKHSVTAILKGKTILDIDSISKICEQERIQTEKRNRIGF